MLVLGRSTKSNLKPLSRKIDTDKIYNQPEDDSVYISACLDDPLILHLLYLYTCTIVMHSSII